MFSTLSGGLQAAFITGMGIASIIGLAGNCLQAVTNSASQNSATPFEQLLKSLQEHHANVTTK